MTSRFQLDHTTVSEARDGLRRGLEAIRKEELTAGPGYVARLEGAIAARLSPDQVAGVVVEDHGQVALPLAVADLVDPDPLEVGEEVSPSLLAAYHPGDDGGHTAPADPQQDRHRALGAAGHQPGHLVLELGGEPGAVPGPGHRSHHHPMLWATDPGTLRLQPGHRAPQVQSPPPPRAFTPIEPGAVSAAQPAAVPIPPA